MNFFWKKGTKNKSDEINDELSSDNIKQGLSSYIVDNGLPNVLLEIIKEEVSSSEFSRAFGTDYNAPYSILQLTEKEQQIYQTNRYQPIFSYSHSTIFAFDTELGGFIRYDVEDELDEKDIIVYSWDGLFVNQILFWWECEIPDEEIISIGDYLGLNHTREILRSIYDKTNGNGFKTVDSASQWELEILKRIDGVIQ
ncbi:hypothetical protein KFE98_10600 [bacterium SCSIO 12741]|nr:hypothetical protein KFE98_10600 [bacterium SCSIO 12741]